MKLKFGTVSESLQISLEELKRQESKKCVVIKAIEFLHLKIGACSLQFLYWGRRGVQLLSLRLGLKKFPILEV